MQSPQAVLGPLPWISNLVHAYERHRLFATLAVLLPLMALAAALLVTAHARANAAYTTQAAAVQTLTQTVTASGTVNPQSTVNVGTQVSGTISALYVDFNSKVKAGQVLARIDPSQLKAQLAQARAALAQCRAQAAASAQSAVGAQSGIGVAQANTAVAQANAGAAQAAVATADANVAKSQSAYDLAQQTLARDKSLLAQGYVAQSQYDADYSGAVAAQSALKSAQATAVAARAQAVAGVSQAQASSAQGVESAAQAAGAADTARAAAAAVQAAQAQVQQDDLNLQHSVIASPVDGTVIDRAVSVGQTVAASLQTPTLFTIAQNLGKMEVDISVGEPDIGNVKPGEHVQFSVLAYPNEVFKGVVSQVRVNPTTVNNVVTYTVITLVDNPNDKLLPGMTANAAIDVATARNALVVPAQALAFRPSGGMAEHHASGTSSPWGETAPGGGAMVAVGNVGLVFVERNGQATPVRVKVDLVSGTQVAVTPIRGTLVAGDAVITGSSASRGAHAVRTAPAMRGAGGGLGRAFH